MLPSSLPGAEFSPGTVAPLDGSVWSLYYVSLEGKDALWA